MRQIKLPVAAFIGVFIGALAVMGLLTFVFQLCWNNSVAEYFDLKHLNYWQAFGFVVLLGFIGNPLKSNKKGNE